MHDPDNQSRQISGVFKNDPVIFRLYEQFGNPDAGIQMDVFNSLVRSIVAQQLSIRAASTIYGRFSSLFDGTITTKKLIDIEFEKLRNAGLSNSKAKYVKNVAVFFKENDLEGYNWAEKTDQEIIDLLTQIKGVGVWTVQMLLMFTLDRPDVFPIEDLGIRMGMKEQYELKSEGKALREELLRISEHWKPYRTLASKLIWLGKDSS